MSKTQRISSSDLRILLLPLTLSLVIVIIFISLAKVTLAKISAQLSLLKEAATSESSLKEKLAVLQNVQQGILPGAEISAIVLPEKNSALTMVSQLKTLASARAVLVTNLKLGGEKEEGAIKSMTLSFKLVAPDTGLLFDFLKNINSLAPLAKFEEIKIQKGAEGTSADVRLLVFWSDFPTKISDLKEPVNRLSAKEQELLTKLSDYILPTAAGLVPVSEGERENPFY